MSWTAPRTWITGEVPTSGIFNTHVRDDLLALQPVAATVATNESRANAAYGALTTPGPTVTANTGATVLLTVGAYADNNGGTGMVWMGVAISGASTIAAFDVSAFGALGSATAGMQSAFCYLLGSLTPGTNTFTAQYRAPAGTGRWADRIIIIEAPF